MPREPLTPPRFEDLPDLLTPEDARAFLQVGKNQVYEMVKAGTIPAIRFGKLIRIPKKALINGSGNNGHE